MRIDWIDRWKGLLIMLVVAGHVFGAAGHLCANRTVEFYNWSYRVIYCFHMSAFFWLAGVCWRSGRTDGFVRFVLAKARRLLVPYFVFALLSAIAYSLCADAGEQMRKAAESSYYAGYGWRGWGTTLLSILHAGGWPSGRGFQCNSVLWFLPVMFVTSCAYWWLDRLVSGRSWRLAIAGCLAALACGLRMWGVGSLPWGLGLVPWYLCFVTLGACTAPAFGLDAVADRAGGRLCETIALPAAWIVYGVVVLALPDLWFAYASATWYCVFFAMAVVGTCLSAWTAQALSVRALSALGGASLGIMLIHKFVVMALELRVPPVRRWLGGAWPQSVATALTVVLLSVSLSYALTLAIRRLAPWALGERRSKG